MHDIISILQIYTTVFNCFVNVYHFFIIKKIVKKYSLNITLLYILMQYINNLIVMTNI